VVTDEPKKPGLIQIMRMASSPDFQRNIKATGTQLNHGHAMLARVMEASHEKIHALAVKTVTEQNPRLKKDMPEIADAAINGLCMYKMIAYSYVVQFGMKEYMESCAKFPGVE
jgi:hypothetical protein